MAASHSHSMLIYVTAAAAEISFHVQVCNAPICHADPSKQTQSERSCDETLAKIGMPWESNGAKPRHCFVTGAVQGSYYELRVRLGVFQHKAEGDRSD